MSCDIVLIWHIQMYSPRQFCTAASSALNGTDRANLLVALKSFIISSIYSVVIEGNMTQSDQVLKNIFQEL